MPQDLFQIALEHHRVGRLRQAESKYRTLLEQDPSHGDALHWLGVLLHQAGDFHGAVPLLERAAAQRPDDAAFQNNLAQAYLAAGRAADAVATLQRAVDLSPHRPQTLVALAHALLARAAQGDADAAVAALQRARSAGLDAAALHHDLGVALLAAGRTEESIASLGCALTMDPNAASTCLHMALAHRAKNEPRGVRKFLNKALEIDPSLAPAWQALGELDLALGNDAQAAASFEKANRLHWQATASPPSVAALEERITPDEPAAKLHAALADLANLAVPSHVPAEQVATLFDRYAESFDQHLLTKLDYRVPQLLARAVALARPGASEMDVCDLGCGTGLCGALLRPLSRTLHGVDVSPGMIEQARARGIYDHLEVGDLLAALRRSPARYDLLIAGDVFNYIGDLAPVMEAAAGALRSGGLLVFSVESAGGDRFHLQRHNHRYAHSRPYVQHVGSIHGFRTRSMDEVVLRSDAGRTVQGLLVVLDLPG